MRYWPANCVYQGFEERGREAVTLSSDFLLTGWQVAESEAGREDCASEGTPSCHPSGQQSAEQALEVVLRAFHGSRARHTIKLRFMFLHKLCVMENVSAGWKLLISSCN